MSLKPSGSEAQPSTARRHDVRLWEQAQVLHAAQGDERAFRAIVEQHQRGMHALAARMVGDHAEAEDLVQEAFARAFSRLEQFDWSYRLSTWLYRIVLNSCRDHLKSPRRSERPADIQELNATRQQQQADDALLTRERSDELRRALAKLRPNYAEILVWKHLLELSYAEIHALTGTPITGLKIRAVRARDRLRELLREQD